MTNNEHKPECAKCKFGCITYNDFACSCTCHSQPSVADVAEKSKEQSELAVFWDEIQKNLPKSQERAALGDHKIFVALAGAYPKIREYIYAQGKQDERARTEKLIIEEMLICQKEGTPTSRLTSLLAAIDNMKR